MKYKQVQLKDICDFVSGGTPDTKVKEYWQGDIPWITGADIQDDRIIEPREHITSLAIQKSATNLITRRSVLLATRTGVGKVAINDFDICISQDFTALIPDSLKLIPEFLYYGIQANRRYLHRNQRGATIQGVTREVVLGLSLPLPPLAEQKRIAAILEKADRLRRLRRYARELSDTFLQSVFLEMFGDPGINPKGWKVVKIGDVVSSSQYGTSKRSNNEMIGYPIIGMGNVTENGKLELSSLSYVDLSPAEFDKLKLEKGDVIFNRTNSTELVGKTALWSIDIDAVIASYLVKIRLTDDILPTYFVGLVNIPSYKQLFQLRCRKAVGQSNISPTLLKEFNIPLPHLVEQKTFQRAVSKFEDIHEYYREAERQCEQLFQSILYREFRGEL